MTWAHGPVVTRRRLGGELKRLREQSGKKLEEVARELECSPSKISRLENGKGLPRSRDVRDMLDVYGVDNAELRAQLLEWARTGQQPMWWRDYAEVLPPGFETYLDLEWDASRICAYESHLVHGLLQTPEYAQAILANAWAGRHPSVLERMLEVRQKRQHVLSAEHGLEFRCVLDESALHRVVASPAVMRAQIVHLIEVAEAGHIDIRVLPFTAGPLASFGESFAKLEFSEGLDDGVVYLERSESLANFLYEEADLRRYEHQMGRLLEASLAEADSVPLMDDLLRRT